MSIISNGKLNDARVVRTRKNFRDTFCSICTTKPLSDITITEIADAAHINRKTFYLHYKSINDLAEDVVINISNEISSGFISDHSDKGLSANILTIYRYIEDHKAVMTTLLYNNSYLSVSNKLIDAILSLEYFEPFYQVNPVPAIIKGYFTVIFSIYQRWYDEKSMPDADAKPATIEELADNCAQMLLHGANN